MPDTDMMTRVDNSLVARLRRAAALRYADGRPHIRGPLVEEEAAELLEAVRQTASEGRPLSTPRLPKDGRAEWRFILDLFARHGAPPPPTRLRDELVGHLAWAEYGLALDTALTDTLSQEER